MKFEKAAQFWAAFFVCIRAARNSLCGDTIVCLT